MLNHIIVMGRLTRDPELRYTQSNTAVVSFTVAVDRDRAPEGQEKQTDFIDCVAWRSTADFISRYFHKGSMAVVSGRLQLRDWTDKEGSKRRCAEILAETVYFGESKRSESIAPAAPAPVASPPVYTEMPGYGANNPFEGNHRQVEMYEDDGELPF